MEKVATIGLDIAKSVFQVHGVAADGEVLTRRSPVRVWPSHQTTIMKERDSTSDW